MKCEYCEEYKPEWISVEDELPQKSGDYLCYLIRGRHEYIERSHFSVTVERMKFGWELLGTTVTHWMPLPEPPKEAE